MSTIYAPAIHDLFSGSFPALRPSAADVDRPRLLRALRGSAFRESNILPYVHRPFDTRWLHVDRDADREYLGHVANEVTFLGVGANGDLPLVTHRAAAELDAPLQLFPMTRANLAAEATEYVRHTGIAESDLFHHVIAMLAGRRGGTPQISLPGDKGSIQESALLGYRFASLFAEHDPLLMVSPQARMLRAFGVPTRIGKEARMLRGSVLRVTSDEVVTRIYQGEELAALAELGGDDALALLGRQTCDVYLNDKAFWRNVPLEVWRYTHRGVPLLRTWLRDRRAEVLGRGLVREEVTHFSTAVRRIAELLLLQPALKKNAS